MGSPVLSPRRAARHRTGHEHTRDPAAAAGGRARAAVAGLVGAGVALGLAEVVNGVAPSSVPSPVVAVGDAVVDLSPGDAVRTGIDTLGHHDKPILLAGIVVVTLLVGAWLGGSGRRRWQAAATGGAVLVGVGLWAASREAGAAMAATSLAYVLAAGAGAAVVAGLWRLAGPPADPSAGRRPPAGSSAPATAEGSDASPALAAATDPDTSLEHSAAPDPAGGPSSAPPPPPGRGQQPTVVAASPSDPPASRRQFLAFAGAGAVFAAAAAAGGARLRGRSSVEAARRALVLPPSSGAADIPSGAATLDSIPGISPFVTANRDFYRIDTALLVPQVNPDRWQLRITGLVDRPVTFRLDDLLAMSLVEQQVTISCVSNEVGGDLVGNAAWRGVPLADLLQRAGVRPEATQLIGESVDGFTAGFPVSAAFDGRPALVVVGMNGQPLPVEHGFPARLVVAGLYGYVSATKWLSDLRLTRWEDEEGYWIPRGWSRDGPIKTQSRIDVPHSGARLDAGTVAVAGIAWAPTRGVDKVELQVDDGPWQPARLSTAGSDVTWSQWVVRWAATAGSHRLRVRATDRTGAVQLADRHDPAPDGATGLHTIRVQVV